MKTNLFSYNSILFTLIIILISTITIWKLPQTQNGYTHIGIAVYDMDDTFINDYVTKLQNKIDRSSFSGKKVLYEIFDAEGNANRQEQQQKKPAPFRQTCSKMHGTQIKQTWTETKIINWPIF